MPPIPDDHSRWVAWLLSMSMQQQFPLVDITASSAPAPSYEELSGSRADPPAASIRPPPAHLIQAEAALIADYVLSSDAGRAPRLVPNPHRSAAALLARRAGPARWIVMLTVSEPYLDLAHQWLCSARLAGVGYYVFLAQDAESRRRLAAAGEPVLEASDLDPRGDLARLNLTLDGPGEAEYGSVRFQMTMALRTFALGRVLALGLHAITADLDGVWLRDPLPALHPNATVQGQEHKRTKLSGGLVAVRSDPAGRGFWARVLECQLDNLRFLRAAAPGTYTPSKYTEQECVNDQAALLLRAGAPGFSVHVLPAAHFPDGPAFFDRFDSARMGILPYVAHNNWLVGTQAKLDRLRRAGLLFDGPALGPCRPVPHPPAYDLTRAAPNDARVVLDWGPAAAAAAAATTTTTTTTGAATGGVAGGGGGGLRYRIHVLTMDRPASLRRLLASLQAADYLGRAVAVVILVDRPAPGAGGDVVARWAETLGVARAFRLAGAAAHRVVERGRNHGLVSQWVDSWPAALLICGPFLKFCATFSGSSIFHLK